MDNQITRLFNIFISDLVNLFIFFAFLTTFIILLTTFTALVVLGLFTKN